VFPGRCARGREERGGRRGEHYAQLMGKKHFIARSDSPFLFSSFFLFHFLNVSVFAGRRGGGGKKGTFLCPPVILIFAFLSPLFAVTWLGEDVEGKEERKVFGPGLLAFFSQI